LHLPHFVAVRVAHLGREQAKTPPGRAGVTLSHERGSRRNAAGGGRRCAPRGSRLHPSSGWDEVLMMRALTPDGSMSTTLRKIAPVLVSALVTWGGAGSAAAQPAARTDLEALPYAPRSYVCQRTAVPLTIDGRLDEAAWQAAPWTERFVDIDGVRDVPLRTRVKMLWDDQHFYIAAELEEPDLWATLTERDAIIFHDNDFEVFIDPDGDTHAYYELEVNALATAWDLLLVRPYRDGGPALHAWDIAGLQVAVDLRGTLNRPGDRDEGWTVEMALPWEVLKEAAPARRPPRAGEYWRVNFSRVQWQLDVKDGRYVKRLDPATGTPYPEDNWVWSPQGAINMHMPERWGYVRFADTAGPRPSPALDPNEQVKWALRRLYYRQQAHRRTHGRYATELQALDAAGITVPGLEFRPTLQVTDSLFEISAPGVEGVRVRIRQDGRVWVDR
jgi:hypothetical protein